ncbi:MAG: hypothetical protein J7J42_05400 [Thermoplasmata archaeon]|nr:hypothetical protein [Thermoplasmata archaeon]
MNEGMLFCTTFASTILFAILFSTIYFSPKIFISFHPWICERDPEEYDYEGIFRWYSNWMHRICSYRCHLPEPFFKRVWLKFSIIYTLVALLLIYVFFNLIEGKMLSIIVFAIGVFVIDVLLRGWVEYPLKENYLRRKQSSGI